MVIYTIQVKLLFLNHLRMGPLALVDRPVWKEDQPGVDRSNMEASAVEASGNSGRPCSGYTRHPVDVEEE
jgi:hypothetical protein